MVIPTLKVVGAVALLSYGASTWLAGSAFDQQHLARLAAPAGGGEDPITTGSLGRGAAGTRLDPCTVPAIRRGH